MGIAAPKTDAACLDAICEQLAATQRPLILDEADYLVGKNGMVELVRDVYEGSQSPILLVGEEQMPNKLKRFERFHGRVLSWIPAQPVSLEDARLLGDDVLRHLVELAHGSVRRVTVNLVNLAEAAAMNNLEAVDMGSLKSMGEFELYKGESPKRNIRI